jgi:hypothetical protein
MEFDEPTMYHINKVPPTSLREGLFFLNALEQFSALHAERSEYNYDLINNFIALWPIE